ncbi:uncharacterized protein BO87DRAFT_167863 [Aspergillus neoniger CBS 115656]|uniref:Uncharacterized protein n=1 Tax=Aspergillus neoniger (strain CBS 115656) TaxID=1448310 RepID=A0A318Z0C2_ASPNB|nr:hypothetical protein BO87DRAFT_167863 [Aspergillus neoniger CBS 115656]PYH38433.1 hypothetical protein BO87DRAFT_167863 [Aspergillus neoniger CBS 115656]
MIRPYIPSYRVVRAPGVVKKSHLVHLEPRFALCVTTIRFQPVSFNSIGRERGKAVESRECLPVHRLSLFPVPDQWGATLWIVASWGSTLPTAWGSLCNERFWSLLLSGWIQFRNLSRRSSDWLAT